MTPKSNLNKPLSEKVFFNSLESRVKSCFPEVFSKPNNHLKRSILKASDQYVFTENKSLWSQTWFQDAYLSYFIFTQSSRIYKVLKRNKKDLESIQIENVIDFGSGPGTAQYVFEKTLDKLKIKKNWVHIDADLKALSFAKKYSNGLKTPPLFLHEKEIPKPSHPNDLLFLSYSLCEGFNFENAFLYNHILILEPGQLLTSKKLILLRNEAIEKGFNILSPCTHQKTCPLTELKKQWCHDHALKPDFLKKYDLPFSDIKLNMSYLFMSKTLNNQNEGLARLIGDLRPEKGKKKIALCQGEDAQFLTWLKKTKLQNKISRGDLIKVPDTYEKKGNEIRITDEVQTF